MPTSRPRHQVTETDEVAEALDAAARRWPDEPRSRLIVRLIVANGAAVADANDIESVRRRAAVEAWAGSFTGAFDGPDTRSEWPA